MFKATLDVSLVIVGDALRHTCQTEEFVRRKKYQAVTLMACDNHRLTHSGITESANVVLKFRCRNACQNELPFSTFIYG